jgi:hypothetical protein
MNGKSFDQKHQCPYKQHYQLKRVYQKNHIARWADIYFRSFGD